MAPLVQLQQGSFQGFQNDDSIYCFLGLPYAEPFQRFQQPKAVHPKTSSELQAAHEFGANCPQTESKIDHIIGPLKGSQDEKHCGVLSVHTPALDPTPSLLPVICFIHGGAYDSGGSQTPTLDGSVLAKEGNCVVICINYRLGLFGFLYEHGRSLEGPELPCGIADMRLALLWIQQNVAAFGGDCNNITLMGQSAGGYSVQVMIDLCPELFNRAILLSAPAHTVHPLEQNQRVRTMVLESLPGGVDLTTASVQDLLAAETKVLNAMHDLISPFGPTTISSAPPSHAPAPTTKFTKQVVISWTQFDGSCITGGIAEEEKRQSAIATTDKIFRDPAKTLATALRERRHEVTTIENIFAPSGSIWGSTHGTDLPLLFGDETAWKDTGMVAGTPWSEWREAGVIFRKCIAAFARDGSRLRSNSVLNVIE